MNPFDLNGPNFLVFYAVCGAVVCLVLYLLRLQEPQTPDGAVPTDPQLIAYLRGGATEALRITAVTLLERGALVLGPNDTFRTDPNHTLPRDASAIDRLRVRALSRRKSRRSRSSRTKAWPCAWRPIWRGHWRKPASFQTMSCAPRGGAGC